MSYSLSNLSAVFIWIYHILKASDYSSTAALNNDKAEGNARQRFICWLDNAFIRTARTEKNF